MQSTKKRTTIELYKCPCCGQYTLEEDYEDSYEICSVCGWEREYAYELEPDNPEAGSSNGWMSLNEAREYWKNNHKRLTYEMKHRDPGA